MSVAMVTGPNSGIGRVIARSLAERGHHVVAAGRSERRIAPVVAEIKDSGGSAEFLPLDLASLDSARTAATAFKDSGRTLDVLVNSAGIGVNRRGLTKDGFEVHFGINHLGHFMLTHHLRHTFRPGTRIVQVASSVHDRAEGIDFDRLQRRSAFMGLNEYAVSKLAGEHYSRVFYQLYGLPTVCLRYFNVFGPRQDPGSEYAAVIPKFITALKNGEQPTVYGDGEQSRDFTYIDNTVDGNILAAENPDIAGDVFNCACGSQFTLNELLDRLRKIIGVETGAIYTDPRPGDIKHSFAAIEKISKFGFKPTVDFNEGLRRTVEFFTK